ncbi:Transcriptional regulatory protein WalR [Pirellula sp. SH-Sr6A]|uniref:response regulator n=1 Tax=Pirellula sp. SH-Sr6A TaxID=1632865 RepID=UPI00078EF1F0|nr:response regulator [Pirellula sp. SH-Sr6A]AMV32990.1 Transcriptional regulatory protein WalR [Pirellula sp. SH-Sr6A]
MSFPHVSEQSPRAAKVLIAEDSIVIGNLLRFNLERAGLDATLAANGQEAIHLLQQEHFDILLTDYEMPILNGEQICDMLRNELHNHDMHIVMCSAKTLELDTDLMRQKYGIERLLQKPFSMTELVSVVRSLVSGRTDLLEIVV